MPSPAKASFLDRVRGNTTAMLVSKIHSTATDKTLTIPKRVSKLQGTIDKLVKAVVVDPLTEETQNVMVKSIASLIPSQYEWIQRPKEGAILVGLIKKILSSFNSTTWNLDCNVPQSVKKMYTTPAPIPTTTTSQINPAVPISTASTDTKPTLGSGWKKAKKVMMVSSTVQYIENKARDSAQERFVTLGTSAPLLYICLQSGPKGKSIPEPDAALELIEALIKAGANPAKYHDAILTRALRCDWPKCADLIKTHCPDQIIKAAESKLSETHRKKKLWASYKAPLNHENAQGDFELDLSVLWTTEKHSDFVNFGQYSPTEDRILTAGNDGNIKIFATPSVPGGDCKLVWTSRSGGSAMHGTWSEDGTQIAGAFTNGSVVCYSGATGATELSFQHVNPETDELSKVYSVSYSPDGKWLVTCAHDGILRVFDISSGELLMESDDLEDGVFVGAFIEEDRFITAWQSGRVRLFDFDVDIGVEIAEELIINYSVLSSIAVSPIDLKFVVSGGDGKVRVMEIDDDSDEISTVHTFANLGTSVSSAQFSADGKSVVTVTGDGVIRLFSVETGHPIASAQCPFVRGGTWIKSATLSRNRPELLITSTDGFARACRYSLTNRPTSTSPQSQSKSQFRYDEALADPASANMSSKVVQEAHPLNAPAAIPAGTQSHVTDKYCEHNRVPVPVSPEAKAAVQANNVSTGYVMYGYTEL